MSVGMSQPSLRGQMALKSSPFNSTSGKLCAQHMVIDHMNAHYKKLLNAKSAIDASVPKTHTCSQKARDRVKRESLSKSPTTKPLRPNSSQGTARKSKGKVEPKMQSLNYDEFRDDFTVDEIDCINTMVQETYTERQGYNQDQKATSRSASSVGLRTSRGMLESMSMDTRQRRNMSADVLDKRAHMFKEPEKNFTPRTLRTNKYSNIPSKLSQTKHFRPASSKQPSRSKDTYTGSHMESEILDETIISRDFDSRLKVAGTVPKLDISIDQDHMKWLQEQSARHVNPNHSPIAAEIGVEIGRTPTISKHVEKRPAIRNPYTAKMIAKEEEKISYLDFVNDVTSDILVRGIFTNRVLRNVFEDHIEKNKDRLDETRMRSMLDTLREDLGIPRNDGPAHIDDHGMGSNRPPVRSKTLTTGYNGVDSSQYKHIPAGEVYADVKPSRVSRPPEPQADLPTTGPIAEHRSTVQVAERRTAAVRTTQRQFTDTDSAKPAPLPDLPKEEFLMSDIPEQSERASTNSRDSRASASNHVTTNDLPAEGAELPKPRPRGSRPASGKSLQSRTSSVKDKDDALVSLLGLDDVGSQKSEIPRSESNGTLGTPEVEVASLGSRPSANNKDEFGTDFKETTLSRQPLRQPSIDVEEEDNDLESNADFGKTTLFARTTAFGKTRPISQDSSEYGSDGEAQPTKSRASDEMSDRDDKKYNYDDDDDF